MVCSLDYISLKYRLQSCIYRLTSFFSICRLSTKEAADNGDDEDTDAVAKEELVWSKTVSIKHDSEKKSEKSAIAMTELKVEKFESDGGHERKQVKQVSGNYVDFNIELHT